MSLWSNKKFGPMLLDEKKEPFNSEDYLFELKFDGIRALIFATPSKVIIQNRHKQDISYLYPELQEIKKIVKCNTIFDGEIVVFQNGYPSFSKLQERAHLKDKKKILNQCEVNPVVFVCFDILYKEKDLIDLTLSDRKKILDKYEGNDVFIKNKSINKEGIKLFKEVKKLNLEGIVAKLKLSKYEINTRVDYWIKIKNWQEERFFIGGFEDKSKGNVVSLYLGEKRKGVLYFVGKVSMGKKHNLYAKLKKAKPIKKTPFINFDNGILYIRPRYKCKIDYMERTKSNHLRQPIFIEESDQ